MISQQTNWFVITGGPCSGKSKTIERLACDGYRIVPEIARIIIDEHLSAGKDIEEIRNPTFNFQRKILELQSTIEDRLDPNEIVFFDRGLLDVIPFLEIQRQELDMGNIINKRLYKKVFLLEQISYQSDYARIENQFEAEKLRDSLEQVYVYNNYIVERVPVMKISERVKYILGRIPLIF